MRATYDADTDALTLVFRKAPVAESDEIRDGLIIDYDKEGRVLALELLDASESIRRPSDFAAAVESAMAPTRTARTKPRGATSKGSRRTVARRAGPPKGTQRRPR